MTSISSGGHGDPEERPYLVHSAPPHTADKRIAPFDMPRRLPPMSVEIHPMVVGDTDVGPCHRVSELKRAPGSDVGGGIPTQQLGNAYLVEFHLGQVFLDLCDGERPQVGVRIGLVKVDLELEIAGHGAVGADVR